MFCTNCGRQNDEGMAYCENCGNPLKFSAAENTSSPQPSYPNQAGSAPQYGNSQPQARYAPHQSPPQAQYGPYGSVPPQAAYANPPYAPAFSPAPAKKKNTGLIVGLSVGATAVILAVVIIVLLAGKPPVIGTWYSEDRGVALVFKENGIVVSRSASGPDEGNYTFDVNSDTGEIKADNRTYDFMIRGNIIYVESVGEFIKADDGFDLQEFLDEQRD